MANDRSRLNAPGFPQFRERDLYRKNGWLRKFRSMHLGRFFRAAQLFHQRKRPPRAHHCIATFDGFPEYGLVLKQVASHAPPLRTLPAHDESDARQMRSTWCEAHADLGILLALRVAVQLADHFSDRPRSERDPIRMMIAPGSEGIGKIRQDRRVAIRI